MSVAMDKGSGLPERDLHLDRGFQAQLRRVYLDTDARCPSCRYELRGVPGPRCPECGNDVSDFLRVADTNLWRLRRERMRWLVRRLASWVVFGLVAIGATLVWSFTLGWL